MPEISVIMPARNADVFLRRAITTTLAALPKDSQLIVMDDGSTDRTLDIVERVEDPRLTIMVNKSSIGVARSLNAMLLASDSRFVARMDADDWVFPQRFVVQRRQIRGKDAVFSTMVAVENGRPRLSIPVALSSEAVRAALLIENPLAHPTAFLDRAFLDSVGNYRVTPAEDHDLWLRFAAAGGRIFRSSIPTVAYTRHSGQSTKSAAWIESVKADTLLRDSYEQLLGGPAPWFHELIGAAWGEAAVGRGSESLNLFRLVMRERLEPLPTLQRAFLSRRLNRLGLAA